MRRDQAVLELPLETVPLTAGSHKSEGGYRHRPRSSTLLSLVFMDRSQKNRKKGSHDSRSAPVPFSHPDISEAIRPIKSLQSIAIPNTSQTQDILPFQKPELGSKPSF